MLAPVRLCDSMNILELSRSVLSAQHEKAPHKERERFWRKRYSYQQPYAC